jgi:hypothetical protein
LQPMPGFVSGHYPRTSTLAAGADDICTIATGDRPIRHWLLQPFASP